MLYLNKFLNPKNYCKICTIDCAKIVKKLKTSAKI
jgi:hypothetical protein